MRNKYSVAILGATGLVGRNILAILAERNFPVSELKLLATERTAGSKISYKDQEYIVEETTNKSFKGVDIVIASAGAATSKKFTPIAIKAGATVVDNSSAYRMEEGVPLVVAGVNDQDLIDHQGIVANPNCSTAQLMPVLKTLNDHTPIKRIVISTYQSVSGAGKNGMSELGNSTIALLKNQPYENKVFKKPIAFNLIPHIDVFYENGYTKEELKLIYETRKILHLPELKITATAVRVPVQVGHSESVNIEFNTPLTAEIARNLLSQNDLIRVMDQPFDDIYPTPLDAEGTDPVLVGRIRQDISNDHAIDLWVVADNLRIGAALNAVRIAEKLVKLNVVKPSLV